MSVWILRDVQSQEKWALRDGFSVGRAPGDLQLVDQPLVSRRQGEFVIQEDILSFRQANVLNPIRHNGKFVASSAIVALLPGDRLDIGTRSFVVEEGARPNAIRLEPTQDAAVQSAPSLPSQEKPIFESAPQAMADRPGLAWLFVGAFFLSVLLEIRILVWMEGASLGQKILPALCGFFLVLQPFWLVRFLWDHLSFPSLEKMYAGMAGVMLLFFALQWGVLDVFDQVTGVFSKVQAQALVRNCSGAAFESGACAEQLNSCQKKCRSYAMPMLADAASELNAHSLRPGNSPESPVTNGLQAPAVSSGSVYPQVPSRAAPPPPLSPALRATLPIQTRPYSPNVQLEHLPVPSHERVGTKKYSARAANPKRAEALPRKLPGKSEQTHGFADPNGEGATNSAPSLDR